MITLCSEKEEESGSEREERRQGEEEKRVLGRKIERMRRRRGLGEESERRRVRTTIEKIEEGDARRKGGGEERGDQGVVKSEGKEKVQEGEEVEGRRGRLMAPRLSSPAVQVWHCLEFLIRLKKNCAALQLRGVLGEWI